MLPLDNASHLGVLYKKTDKIFQNPFQNTYLEDDIEKNNIKRN